MEHNSAYAGTKGPWAGVCLEPQGELLSPRASPSGHTGWGLAFKPFVFWHPALAGGMFSVRKKVGKAP